MGAYEFVHAAADSDGDMLGDFDEIDLFRTDPTRGDTDGDRMSDGREILAGTDPLDGNSLLRITECRVRTNSLSTVIHWHGIAGRRYAVQASTNLQQPAWTRIGEVVGSGGTHSFTSSVPPGPVFYRVTTAAP